MTESGEVVRVRLSLSYDGTDFSGWASQPGLRTVQGVLEEGLARLVRGEQPRVTVAGRTDAGVHARGQVAHVDLPVAAWQAMPGRGDRTPEQGMRARLAGVLPADVVVWAASVAPAGFDARFSAIARRYSYRVSDASETRDPVRRREVLWYSRPVDVGALNAASASLTGLRDFAAFCRAREGATTIRDLTDFSWRRVPDGPDAGLLVAELRADAFCHSMVRSLVGAVLSVGDGRRDQVWLDGVAALKERTAAVAVAEPQGLTLEAVEYPPDDQMASRAESTRARRTLD